MSSKSTITRFVIKKGDKYFAHAFTFGAPLYTDNIWEAKTWISKPKAPHNEYVSMVNITYEESPYEVKND